MYQTIFAVLCGLAILSLGCTEQAQMEDAAQDVAEEREETQEAIQEGEDPGDIAEERQETQEAEKELQQERRDVLEEQTEHPTRPQ